MPSIHPAPSERNSKYAGQSQSLTSREVCDLYFSSCALATFWRLRKKDPSFPKPFYIGTGHPRYHRADVQAWYDAARVNNQAV